MRGRFLPSRGETPEKAHRRFPRTLPAALPTLSGLSKNKMRKEKLRSPLAAQRPAVVSSCFSYEFAQCSTRMFPSSERASERVNERGRDLVRACRALGFVHFFHRGNRSDLLRIRRRSFFDVSRFCEQRGFVAAT